MAVRSVVLYGDPVLRKKAAPVKEVDDGIRRLLDDMVETMHVEPGVGLAAPQIGVSKRVLVIDLSIGKDKRALLRLVNPAVLMEEGSQTGEEGCLSFPGVYLDVTRAWKVRVEALNERGWPMSVEGNGLLARALLHEFDHVEGRVFLDRVGMLARERAKREIRRLQREGEWTPHMGVEVARA